MGVLQFVCLLMVNWDSTFTAEMPWENWSWNYPQQPIEHFFRRTDSLPYKAPAFECKCPPYKECTVDYKINEAAAEFLNMRGVLKEDELKSFKEEVKEIKATTVEEKDIPKSRRSGEGGPALRAQNKNENTCCCPPRSLMMPSFVSNQKFDDIVEAFDKKKIS